MNKEQKHYKFINSETDNVIFFLSFPENEPNQEIILEDTRKKLAYEKGLYIGSIYFMPYIDSDFDE